MTYSSKISPHRHIDDLKKIFTTLRNYQMKLNPVKCTFGVALGKFLGFMVLGRGIEANLEKIQTIQEMNPPKIVKEVQRFNEKVAALSRFISRSAEYFLSFFQVLKQPKNF